MKKTFITSLILISLAIIPIVLSASLFTDKTNYSLLETVYITGIGFTPGEQVGVEVDDPTGTARLSTQIGVNSSGGFNTSYIIPDNAIIGTYNVYARTHLESAQNTFTVVADTQSPQWSNLKNTPTVVTILDDVAINVTWYDNVNLNKVLIWENSTGSWVSYSVGS